MQAKKNMFDSGQSIHKQHQVYFFSFIAKKTIIT